MMRQGVTANKENANASIEFTRHFYTPKIPILDWWEGAPTTTPRVYQYTELLLSPIILCYIQYAPDPFKPLLDVLRRKPCPRGSPCILPEETLEGYEAAIDSGVDFLEMDAVPPCAHHTAALVYLELCQLVMENPRAMPSVWLIKRLCGSLKVKS